MIRLVTLPVTGIHDGPYRDTWKLSNFKSPESIQALGRNLITHVKANGFVIHVAPITPDGFYTVIDGHFLLDVAKQLGHESVNLIVHDEIRTLEQARTAYLSFNYLRSSDWLRDAVITREQLKQVGLNTAISVMADPDLAKDLVLRDDSRWQEFKQVFEEAPDVNGIRYDEEEN